MRRWDWGRPRALFGRNGLEFWGPAVPNPPVQIPVRLRVSPTCSDRGREPALRGARGRRRRLGLGTILLGPARRRHHRLTPLADPCGQRDRSSLDPVVFDVAAGLKRRHPAGGSQPGPDLAAALQPDRKREESFGPLGDLSPLAIQAVSVSAPFASSSSASRAPIRPIFDGTDLPARHAVPGELRCAARAAPRASACRPAREPGCSRSSTWTVRSDSSA